MKVKKIKESTSSEKTLEYFQLKALDMSVMYELRDVLSETPGVDDAYLEDADELIVTSAEDNYTGIITFPLYDDMNIVQMDPEEDALELRVSEDNTGREETLRFDRTETLASIAQQIVNFLKG